jgi:hypothetical protein
MKSGKWIFYFLIAGLFITGTYSAKNSFLLKTPHAKSGIVSLELCYDSGEQAMLLQEWKNNWAYEVVYSKDTGFSRNKVWALPTAVSDTYADFRFILFYTGLIGFLIYRNRVQYPAVGLWSARVGILLIVFAGVTDVLENIFELRAMNLAAHGAASTGPALLVFIPSLIKWVLLIFTILRFYVLVVWPAQGIFLPKANKFASSLVRELWNFRVVVIGLLFLYLVLSFVGQGEDLLIAINSSGWGVFWFILVIFVLAVLNWYLPKTYDNAGLGDKGEQLQYKNDSDQIKTYLGRLTGSATLLVPATGLLSAMQAYHVSYWLDGIPPGTVFLLSLLIFVELLHGRLLDRFYIESGQCLSARRYWGTFILGTGLIIMFAYMAADGRAASLAFLSLAFFTFSFLFLLTVNYRSKIKFNFPFERFLYLASGLVFLLFIAFNIRRVSAQLTAEDRFFSLPVFVAGMVFYTLLISFFLILGKRYKVQFISVLLVTGIAISLNRVSDFHKVSTVSSLGCKAPAEDSLRAYIYKWLESRRGEISRQDSLGKDYPVFFVNAHGGGIKAAAWTTMVVGRLNFLMRQDTASAAVPDFEHYVFSYSGASGGTIGLSLLTGARITYANNPRENHIFSDTATLGTVFRHDYLTDDLVGILGRDAWMGTTGLNLYADRAKVTEEAWERYTARFGISYAAPLGCSWQNPKMEVPLFVSNTYDINDGVKGILAPVKLRASDFPGALLIQGLLKPEEDIHLSSAAFLSARFPYVSPTGKFNEQHHFTDGGTIENSGAETSQQLIAVFRSVVNSLTTPKGQPGDKVFKKIKICILSIPNSIPQMDSVERVRNLSETGAPIAGILHSINGNSVKAEKNSQAIALRDSLPHFSMQPEDTKIGDGSIHPVLPLGWQISDYALDMMQASVRRDRSAIGQIIGLFHKTFNKTPLKK